MQKWAIVISWRQYIGDNDIRQTENGQLWQNVTKILPAFPKKNPFTGAKNFLASLPLCVS